MTRPRPYTFLDVLQRWAYPLLGIMVGMLVIATLVIRLLQVLGREKRLRVRHQRLLDSLGEGVYGVDAQGRCTFINPVALDMLEVTEAEVLGQDQHEMFHHHHRDGSPYMEADCPIARTLGDGVERRVDEWFFRVDGEGFPVSLTVSPIMDGQEVTGAVAVFQDITERKRMEHELMRLATSDTLTGLPNRRHVLQEMDHELARIRRFGGEGCLLMIDLDHFKRINDEFGHAAGDVVLTTLAALMRGSLRQIDTPGRMGGEEFVVLLPQIDQASASVVAERLRAALCGHDFVFGGKHARVTASIGCTRMMATDERVDDVLLRADKALYKAKASGRNQVVLG